MDNGLGFGGGGGCGDLWVVEMPSSMDHLKKVLSMIFVHNDDDDDDDDDNDGCGDA